VKSSFLLNLPSAIIVIAGSIGASLIQSSIQEAVRALVLIKWSLFPPIYDFNSARATLNNLAHKARRLSLLALESDIEALIVVFLAERCKWPLMGQTQIYWPDRLHDDAVRIYDKTNEKCVFYRVYRWLRPYFRDYGVPCLG